MWLEANVINTGGLLQQTHGPIYVHDHRTLEDEDRIGAQVRSFFLSPVCLTSQWVESTLIESQETSRQVLIATICM